jgi:hypothetical protein
MVRGCSGCGGSEEDAAFCIAGMRSSQLCRLIRWGTRIALGFTMRPNESCVQQLPRGGDSTTGSGGGKSGNAVRRESCARNGKKITSFAAMVAPHPCSFGQGRVRVHCTGAARLPTLAIWLLTIILGLVPLQALELCFGPKTKTNPRNHLSRWNGYLLAANPFVKSRALNSQFLCGLRD